MTQLSLQADSALWTQVEPGTEPQEFISRWADVPPSPWKLLLGWHAQYALNWANQFGSAAWLHHDEESGIAAAVAVLAADGPDSIAAPEIAIEQVGRLVEPGISDPLVTEANFGDLGGYAVTHVHELPPELKRGADEAAQLQMLQTVFVAVDGKGTVVFAIVSPQVSNVAGYAMLPIAAVLRTAQWHD